MNYDTATAHEILVMAVTTAYKEDYLPVIESALRKAVIREASVGVVKLSHKGLASDYDIVPHKETP